MSILVAKLSRTCYDKVMPFTMLKSSVLRCSQKQDDEDKSPVIADREFQAAGPQTAKPLEQP